MNSQYELELCTPFLQQGDGRLQPFNLPAIVSPGSASDHRVGWHRAQKAPPSLLPLDVRASDAFRLTITQCRWHIAANAAVFGEKRDAEALHQLRVGLRRLRVALTSFGGQFRSPQIEAVRLRAKDLAQQLASARDLDVFVSQLLEPAAGANGSHQAFSVLRLRAHEARRRAFGDAFLAISGPRLRMFMRDVSEVTDGRACFPPRHQGGKEVPGYEVSAPTVAERILAHRYKQARRRARHLEALSSAERHALRIELKKLRYAAEFFVPFFDIVPAKKFLGRLGRMQDVLGAVNDVAVAKSILDVLVSCDDGNHQVSSPELSFAAGLIYGWHLERAARKWREAVGRWNKFAHTRTFWSPPAGA